MDADRKNFTFDNWYKKIYKIENNYKITLDDIFDFDKIVMYGGDYMVCPRTAKEIEDNMSLVPEKKEKIKWLIETSNNLVNNDFYPFRLSGDADYKLMNGKEKDKKMHYLLNFSLIPVTGGVNNKKNRTPLSQFICIIKEYYSDRSVKKLPIGCSGKKFNDEKKQEKREEFEKEALKAYFDIFDNIEEYCKVVYLMEKEDIDNLKVEDYWNKRKEIVKDIIKEDILGIDISADCYK